MKTTSEITQELFKAILEKINKEYLLTQMFEDGHIKVALSHTIDNVVYHIYVDIDNTYDYMMCDCVLDVWDINGHKMITDKPNIAIDLDSRLIRHYEMVTD